MGKQCPADFGQRAAPPDGGRLEGPAAATATILKWEQGGTSPTRRRWSEPAAGVEGRAAAGSLWVPDHSTSMIVWFCGSLAALERRIGRRSTSLNPATEAGYAAPIDITASSCRQRDYGCLWKSARKRHWTCCELRRSCENGGTGRSMPTRQCRKQPRLAPKPRGAADAADFGLAVEAASDGTMAARRLNLDHLATKHLSID